MSKAILQADAVQSRDLVARVSREAVRPIGRHIAVQVIADRRWSIGKSSFTITTHALLISRFHLSAPIPGILKSEQLPNGLQVPQYRLLSGQTYSFCSDQHQG